MSPNYCMIYEPILWTVFRAYKLPIILKWYKIRFNGYKGKWAHSLLRMLRRFYLSNAEWRSYTCAQIRKLKYEVWVFQYRDIADFKNAHEKIRPFALSKILKEWLDPDSFSVLAPTSAGTEFSIDLPYQ